MIGAGAYYGGYPYGYYDDGYGYDDYAYGDDGYSSYGAASGGGSDDAYCSQRFRSYDPAQRDLSGLRWRPASLPVNGR